MTLALTIALLGVGIVGTAVAGPLNNMLKEGGNKFQKGTETISGEIKIEDKKRLSQAALFTYHRARNCKLVEDQNDPSTQITNINKGKLKKTGYPALGGTVYGAKPDCGGFKSPNPDTQVSGAANDFEGFAGSINFRITSEDPIILDTGEQRSWLAAHLTGASRMGYEEAVLNCPKRHTGPNNYYTVFFEDNQNIDKRTGIWVKDAVGKPKVAGVKGKWVYCSQHDFDDRKSWDKSRVYEVFRDHSNGRKSRHGNRVVLCPGDRGYIQVNQAKGKPLHAGEGNVEADNLNNYFPHIVITETGDDCVEEGPEPELKEVTIGSAGVNTVNSDTWTGLTATKHYGLGFSIKVKNRRKFGTNPRIRVVDRTNKILKEADKTLSPGETWDKEMEYGHRDIAIPGLLAERSNWEKNKRGMHPARALHCHSIYDDKQLYVVLREDGEKVDEREVNVNELMDRCGGTYVPSADMKVKDWSKTGEKVEVTVKVTNNGPVKWKPQVYVYWEGAKITGKETKALGIGDSETINVNTRNGLSGSCQVNVGIGVYREFDDIAYGDKNTMVPAMKDIEIERKDGEISRFSGFDVFSEEEIDVSSKFSGC